MRQHPTAVLAELERLCKEKGIELEAVGWPFGNGHYKIHGKLIVNYYPLSAKLTAYVKGTTKGIQNVTPAHAIEMSQNEPKVVRAGNKDERAGNSRAIRYKMLKGRTFVKCHWCDTMIDLNTSTIEHIVPLDRGGLENANNRTLACKPCNEGRGNSMPELQTVKSKPWEN